MILVILLFTGCVRPESDTFVQIEFGMWGTPAQEQAVREVVKAFESMNPDIKVKLLVMGYGSYFNKMQAMMIGGVAPDVMMIGVNYYDEWASRGVLLDVTDDFDYLKEMGEIMPVPRAAVERDGRYYGYPINVTGLVLSVNIDAFKTAGIDVPADGRITWQEIVGIAPRLSARSAYGDPDAPTDYAMILPNPVVFFWQKGIDLFDDPHHPKRVTINVPEAESVIDFIRRLHERGYVVPTEVGRDEGYRELFRDGRVAIFPNNFISSLMYHDQTSFEWDILRFPEGAKSNVSTMGAMSIGIWADSRNQEAAKKFARFFASPEGARMNMRAQRWQPIYREIAFGEEFLKLAPPPSMHRFSEMMEEGASRPIIYAPGQAAVTRIFNQIIEKALSRPEIPAAEILQEMEVDLQRWLEQMRRRSMVGSSEG